MNPVPSQNLALYRGATFVQAFTVQNEDGTPKDLTDWGYRLQVRDEPDGKLLAELSDADDFYRTAPTDGEFTLEVPGYRSRAWPFEAGFYDLFAVQPLTSYWFALLRGLVIVYPSVTEPTV